MKFPTLYRCFNFVGGATKIEFFNKLLAPEQEETLRRIAKVAPVGISDLSEHYVPTVVQSLVDARLVVRIGTKFDIYWDIFRDYLNSGQLPNEENYLLRVQIGPVLKAMRLLREAGGELNISEFRAQAKLSEHSAMNLIRDLRLLGLADPDAGRVKVIVSIPSTPDEGELVQAIREHIRNHLIHNRLVSRIVTELKTEGVLTLDQLGAKLASWCPYITATRSTWHMYARVLSYWLDLADLATYDNRSSRLAYYEPSTELRQRDLRIRAHRGLQIEMPTIQYSPVERVCMQISAGLATGRANWKGFKKSTLQKAFATLEGMGFITNVNGAYRVSPNFPTSGSNPGEIATKLSAAVMEMPAFVEFIKVLAVC